MVRPKKEDRSTVRALIFTMKLTERERALLDALVEARRSEARDVGEDDLVVTASSIVRSLILRAAKDRGLSAGADEVTKPARKGKRK